MYILLIVVHSLFILISHLFGFFVMEGVFLILMLFFLLYFSPIFFFKSSHEKSQELFTFELSPQKSLIIPLILTYLGIYILAFTFSGTIAQSLHTHLLIFLAIFCIFLGYIISFSWKNPIFFDVLGFHLIFSYITIIVISVYYFFFREFISWIDAVFSVIVMGFSAFFFLYDTKKRKEFFYPFLASIFFTLAIILLFLFPKIDLVFLFGIIVIGAIGLFEFAKKIPFFMDFLLESRIFFLWVVILFTGILSILLFYHFSAIYFLIPIIVFLFSVHIRYSNVVTYSLGIFEIYLLYTFLFFGIISPSSPISTLIFIFFLPLVIIGNTYFWEENQKYDFSIIHYSSIAFGVIFFAYSLLFITWESGSFIFYSFGFLLLAALFFLSYFRFYLKK